MTDVKRVSPQEAKALVDEGYTYVDVRTATEFSLGHPEGAYNVPFMIEAPGGGMAKNPDFSRVMQQHFAKDQKLVVGCKAGGRSLKATAELAADGYTDLVDQRAGMDGARDAFGKLTEPGWAPAGLPTSKDAPGRTYAELAKP